MNMMLFFTLLCKINRRIFNVFAIRQTRIATELLLKVVSFVSLNMYRPLNPLCVILIQQFYDTQDIHNRLEIVKPEIPMSKSSQVVVLLHSMFL